MDSRSRATGYLTTASYPRVAAHESFRPRLSFESASTSSRSSSSLTTASYPSSVGGWQSCYLEQATKRMTHWLTTTYYLIQAQKGQCPIARPVDNPIT